MTKDKITDLIKLSRKKQVELAPQFNMSKGSFNNKIRASETRFNLADLIKLGELTNTQLAFIDENNKPVVVFGKEDLE
ncbi:hypothetical protein [Thomasclavelia cocleata]|jgi:hypothetical protein|uniref:hypothetical protein n=1 Tax=Thomasclavelia cocleata TaxID=69824 RepID=UPI00241C8DEA|nr:hypothetical protein [Thomasclavelia cocleata]